VTLDRPGRNWELLFSATHYESWFSSIQSTQKSQKCIISMKGKPSSLLVPLDTITRVLRLDPIRYSSIARYSKKEKEIWCRPKSDTKISDLMLNRYIRRATSLKIISLAIPLSAPRSQACECSYILHHPYRVFDRDAHIHPCYPILQVTNQPIHRRLIYRRPSMSETFKRGYIIEGGYQHNQAPHFGRLA
jgi:hypothetical protein